jgi:hypothetical protein
VDSADILAAGSVELATTVAGLLLSGANGTVNQIEAQGDSSTIALAAVTASNSNVQLSLLGDYSVILQSVDLQSGTLLVDFSRNTTQSNASATLAVVQAGQLQVSGGSRVNDRVILTGTVDVGNGGVLIEDINQLDINANLTSAGDLTINTLATSTVQLSADMLTAGGDVTLSGGTLAGRWFCGTAHRQWWQRSECNSRWCDRPKWPDGHRWHG